MLTANGFLLRKEGPYYFVSKQDYKQEIIFAQNLLTLNISNAEITSVLSEISRKTKENIIYERDVTGKISGQITEMPLEQGLRVLLETNGFLLDYSDQVFVIRKKPPQSTPNSLCLK